jgi:hypothetical protein
MALLSKPTALTLELMLDTRLQRVQQAMETAFAALTTLKRVAEEVESDWASSPLPGRRIEDMGKLFARWMRIYMLNPR